jgi:cell volume regulation protein A
VTTFGLPLLLAGLTGMAAVVSNRVSQRLSVPAPAFFPVCAAIAAEVWGQLGHVRR